MLDEKGEGSWFEIDYSTECTFRFLVDYRVRTGPWKPGKSWNLKIWIPGLESPGMFVEFLESLEIYISNHKHTEIQSLHLIWVYLCALKVCEFIEKVLEFDIGRSWKDLESEMSKCVWTLMMVIGIWPQIVCVHLSFNLDIGHHWDIWPKGIWILENIPETQQRLKLGW